MKLFDVIGIGSAIVDIFCFVDDETLTQMGLIKGTMQLIDEKQADFLSQSVPQDHLVSGGSCANTLAGLASLGCKVALISKIGSDQLGSMFQQDIEKTGVYFVPTAMSNAKTARSFIFVSSGDKEHTMNTYLGAASELSSADIDENLIQNAEIIYLEGYLWDATNTREAALKAIELAKSYGKKVALSLADVLCVDRHRIEFLALLHDKIDIVFANRPEICGLLEVDDFEQAITSAKKFDIIAVLTSGAEGSVIIDHGTLYRISAEKVDLIVDSTGAGDLYATGFLCAFSQKLSLPECGKMGSVTAAKVITRIGARI